MFIAMNDPNSSETILFKAEDLIEVHFYPDDLTITSSFINKNDNQPKEFYCEFETLKEYSKAEKKIRRILKVKEFI